MQAAGDPPPVRLDVAIEHFGFESDGQYEPDIRLLVSVSARLVRSSDQAELYWRFWRYQGAEIPYFTLAAGAPESLNRMVSNGFEVVADRILFDLLHSSSTEMLNRQTRPIATVAAKYMLRGSELREYDRTNIFAYSSFERHTGRPAAWPDLPVEAPAPGPEPQAAPTTLPAPEPALVPGPGPTLTAAEEQREPIGPPAEAPAEEVAAVLLQDGNWAADTSNWRVRVAVESDRFEGTAFCRARNQRYRIAGSVEADGAVDGSAQPVRALEAGGIHVDGRWPTLVLPGRLGCTDTSVTLVPS
jgi:hypothetical protein